MKKMVIDGDVLAYSLSWVLDKNPNLDPQHLIKTKLLNISKGLGVDKGRLLISGSISKEETYRYSLATIQPYKGNRTNKDKPKSFDLVKEYLKNCKAQIISDGLEVDDYLAIEQSKDPENVIICSTDKDLKMIPGYHYNWVTNSFQTITPFEGCLNFCKQLLTGDRIDNIKGLSEKRPLRGIGDKTALNLLKHSTSYKEMILIVLDQYKERYGKGEVKYKHWNELEDVTTTAEGVLQENAQLLWIRRSVDEQWKLPSYM